jgi:hypothetical protein
MKYRFARLFSFSNRAAGLRLYPCDERPAEQPTGLRNNGRQTRHVGYLHAGRDARLAWHGRGAGTLPPSNRPRVHSHHEAPA